VIVARRVAAPDFRACTGKYDISDPQPDGGIARMNSASTPLAFQPTLVAHDLLHFRQFFPDHFRLGIHNIDLIDGFMDRRPAAQLQGG